ncbi:CocE/NonD family hydrolase [Chelativorans salis]|uniref:CocE/NonD family hydrolase n=1 Tax=Chelativorans salis TaxID=2978478 RepID=A0ABT2LIN8_9HYPH|nr:CocE/NonD family hydrolase [Chelativorans sp. EGI FJ00035]MCT7374184.1 CocE/NonD family hydrolase [Chelativorans sp. EGI FJ00035]
MKYVDKFPYSVEIDDHVEIPMADGVRLSARIWLPTEARRVPVPTILEYIPYRKRFGTAHRDEITHGFLSGHGYACVRVDLRGSGESEGVLADEYLPLELEDGLSVIEWIARQPWCNGAVGMMGISWGGFNALQIAALGPPALKAVVSASSTDDRYSDDVHHMGGCLLGDNLSWASVMFAYNSMPPDPLLVGDKWRDMWFERLEAGGFWLPTWLSHQRRDAYWRHGSIREDYAAVDCPVLLVSGWADGYTNAVFRMLESLQTPRKGLVGPWAHTYPHFGRPGPAIDFLTEIKRWWDHWLKSEANGVMDEPMLRAWMQNSERPTTQYEARPGRWVGEDTWPSARIRDRSFVLRQRSLADHAEATDPVPPVETLQSPLSVGLFAGKWCSYASGPDLAHDQRQEDGGALIFETEPLTETIEILGQAVIDLTVSVDRPIAMIAARLSDVWPDGSATRFTYGLFNLTHRDSREHPSPMQPGETARVTVRLNHIAQQLPAGHKLRLSLSTSYWPLAWPPPEPVMMTVHYRDSMLHVPVREPRAEDSELRELGEPQGARPSRRRLILPEEHEWLVRRNLASDESVLEVIDDRGTYLQEAAGLEVGAKAVERYSACSNDFGSVAGETMWERTLARGDDWRIRTKTRTRLTCSGGAFYVEGDIDAYENERRVFCRTWQKTVPRNLV